MLLELAKFAAGDKVIHRTISGQFVYIHISSPLSKRDPWQLQSMTSVFLCVSSVYEVTVSSEHSPSSESPVLNTRAENISMSFLSTSVSNYIMKVVTFRR
jgi:hypothetical protein